MKEQPEGGTRSSQEQAVSMSEQQREEEMADEVAEEEAAEAGQEHGEDLELRSSPHDGSASDATQLSPIAPFVSKTYGIVNGESDDVVSWWSSGGEDTFVIKLVDVFQEQVLPRFFSHRNYSSFVRQLNNHGFSRVRSPSSAVGNAADGQGKRPDHEAQWWEFKHPKFRRGRKGLLSEIKRRKEKKRTVSSAAQPGMFASQPSSLAETSHTDTTHGVRGEMEHVREQMQGMSRKLDELKSLVVGLVVCVRESGFPMSVPPSPRLGDARVSGSSAGLPSGFVGGCYPPPPQPQQQQQQQQQQQLVPAPPPPPPTQTPPQQQLHQPNQEQRNHHHHHQQQQQMQMPIHQTRQSTTNSNADSWQNSCSSASGYGRPMAPHMHQITPSDPPSRENQGAERKDVAQLEDHTMQPTPTDGRAKRPRNGTAAYHHADQHQAPSTVGVPASAVTSAVDGQQQQQPMVAGALHSGNAGGGAVTASGGSVYHDPWAGFPQQGSDVGGGGVVVAGGGAGAGGGGPQHGGAGVPVWQKRWPDGNADNFYPYHVPVRMAGFPFAVPGMPMPYAVPSPGGPVLVQGVGTGPVAGQFPTASAMMPPRDALPPQGRAGLPLHGVEGDIAMTLSALKGSSKEHTPGDAGQQFQQQQQQHGGDRADLGVASKPSSGHLMGGAPIT